MKTKISKPRPLTKGEITEAALKQLQYTGFKAWRENNLAVRGRKFTGQKGKADIIGYHRSTGIAMYCEVKTASDKFSDDQKLFLNEAAAEGCLCFIAVDENGYQLKKWEVKLEQAVKGNSF